LAEKSKARAATPDIEATQSADAFRVMLSTRLASVAVDEPEGPHQLRVGLRRLRSALGVRPVGDNDRFHELNAKPAD
jgi:CHAD domain-containing protein